MKGKCGVIASANAVRGGNLTIKLKRGGTGGTGGSGPTGYKTKPSRLLHRALAERVGVNLIVKARQAEQRKRKLTPPRVIQGLLGPQHDLDGVSVEECFARGRNPLGAAA